MLFIVSLAIIYRNVISMRGGMLGHCYGVNASNHPQTFHLFYFKYCIMRGPCSRGSNAPPINKKAINIKV